MAQQSAPPSRSLASRLGQRKYILAIAIIAIIIGGTVAAIYLLPKPATAAGLKVDVGAGPRIRFLGFNVQLTPDVKVRQAMAYAVDRAAINNNVFLGLTTPIYSMIPPSMPFSQPVFNTKYGASPDLTQAQNLLTAAGYSSTNKLLIDLWYNSDGHYGDTEPSVALVIKTSIERTGMVTVSLKSEPWAAYRTDLATIARGFPFYLLGWYPDYFDSDDYASPFFTSTLARGQGSFYSNATMESWITQEAAATNDNLRAGNFTLIQNKSAEDVPYIPLWQQAADIEYKPDITGVYLHPVSFKYFIMNKPGATQLNVGTTDSVVCLDPACAYDYFSIEVINQVFDTLLVYEPQTTNIIPGLATEVPTVANGGISADAKTYTYHLRQGVKFTDGSAFNATVMKWSLERVIALGDPDLRNPAFDPNSPYAGSAAGLLIDTGKLGHNDFTTQTNANITILDTYTIQFHLGESVSFFNGLMAFSVSAPVSMQAYGKTTPQPDDKTHIVGTGPYMVSDYTAGKQVVLVKNPSYYNPGIYSSFGISSIPILATVVITHYLDATGLKNALQAGQIDMAYRTLNPTDIKALQG